MKLVLVSDTHGQYPSLPEGDLLIHAGDAAGTGSIKELARFNEWCQEQLKRFPLGVLHVPGNHDEICEENSALYKQMLPGVQVLINDVAVVGGLVFFGSPFTPEFHNWAYQLRSEEQARRVWGLMPEYVDVLITHGPPGGILDAVGGENVGCPYLMERVLQVKPQLHVFGHIHEGYGQRFFNGTHFVNASHMDSAYRPRNLPIVVQLTDPQFDPPSGS